jgi:hypothetical protein
MANRNSATQCSRAGVGDGAEVEVDGEGVGVGVTDGDVL